MKKIILLFCWILVSGILAAQPWSEQTSGVTTTLKSVWCVDNINVWVCGYSGTVLKTTNGGINWINQTGNGIPTNVQLINICGFPSGSTNALAAGYVGSDTWVWKTSNGGTNWIQVFSQPGGFINSVWMTSSTNGFMTGDPAGGRWSLFKTSNGGNNWDSTGLYLPQVGTEAGWNNSLICSPPYIWFGTNNTKIYFSNNNGISWVAQPTTGEVNSYAIFFHPLMQNGRGLFGGANLFQTSNNGTNWTALSSMASGNFGGITSSPVIVNSPSLFQPVWYVRSSNIIYFSSNFGANWNIEYTNPASTSYSHISIAFPGRGIWAVGSLGKISYHDALNSIEQISTEIPTGFSLHQNYPNPFNPKTKIKFEIPDRQRTKNNVQLIIYDALGREVETLLYDKLQAGTYEVTFDGSKFNSGVYFYKLQTENFIQTKKMLMIK